jgi:hypothetical protein
MAKKSVWLVFIIIICSFSLGKAYSTPTNTKNLKWQARKFHPPKLMWDRQDSTVYQNAVKITIYSGNSEKPDAFNLVINNPYQTFYAERDSTGKITNCVYVRGIRNDGPKNSQWSSSLIREFLQDSCNFNGLPEDLVDFLKVALDYMENP